MKMYNDVSIFEKGDELRIMSLIELQHVVKTAVTEHLINIVYVTWYWVVAASLPKMFLYRRIRPYEAK